MIVRNELYKALRDSLTVELEVNHLSRILTLSVYFDGRIISTTKVGLDDQMEE